MLRRCGKAYRVLIRGGGSEKMWGDLRGGKKSVSELRGSPDELTVTLQVRPPRVRTPYFFARGA